MDDPVTIEVIDLTGSRSVELRIVFDAVLPEAQQSGIEFSPRDEKRAMERSESLESVKSSVTRSGTNRANPRRRPSLRFRLGIVRTPASPASV